MAQPITIHKRNYLGQETWQYSGQVTALGDGWVNFEALFNVPGEKDAGYTVFRFGDRFDEWCYADRWYNVAAIYDVHDDHLKGWYCNLTRPAIIQVGEQGTVDIFWDDLALDVWVDPQGTTQILDEDEYAALNLDTATMDQVTQAVAAIQALVTQRKAPFDLISGSVHTEP